MGTCAPAARARRVSHLHVMAVVVQAFNQVHRPALLAPRPRHARGAGPAEGRRSAGESTARSASVLPASGTEWPVSGPEWPASGPEWPASGPEWHLDARGREALVHIAEPPARGRRREVHRLGRARSH